MRLISTAMERQLGFRVAVRMVTSLNPSSPGSKPALTDSDRRFCGHGGRRAIVLLSMLVAMTLVAACQGSWSPFDNTPRGVVRRQYEAIAEKDADKFLDTLDPEHRERLVNSMGWMVLERTVDVRFQDMSFEVLEREGDVARVRATGEVRIVATARRWEAIHEVRKLDGHWYVYAWSW